MSQLSTSLLVFELPDKPIPTCEEILQRFHRLRITIGLAATTFGSAAVGNPGIIKALEKGRTPHVPTLERLGAALDLLEKGHSIPMPLSKKVREHKENKSVDAANRAADNKPIVKELIPELDRSLEE